MIVVPARPTTATARGRAVGRRDVERELDPAPQCAQRREGQAHPFGPLGRHQFGCRGPSTTSML